MIYQYYGLNEQEIITWSAVFASVICYMAGSRTCMAIVKNKTTGDVPLFPFVASLYSGVIWLKYSLMINSVQYGITNLINTVLQSMYIIVYHGYCKDKRRCNKLLGVSITLLYLILLYAKYFQYDDAIKTLGFIGCFVTIMMTGAPLISLRTIIETKSTCILDFGFIITCFFANLLWAISGYYMSDINVALPNAVGFLLAIFQLSLFVIYPTSKSSLLPK